MTKCGIQIGDGAIMDSYAGYGLIYKSSDSIFGAPAKKRDSTSYAEEAGEHVDRRTVADAFDFKMEFLLDVSTSRMPRRINALIENFNAAMFTASADSDVMMAQPVTIYDYYKWRKITGIPQPISTPTDYHNVRGNQCAIVELELRVDNPKLCDFHHVTTSGIGEMAVGVDFQIN